MFMVLNTHAETRDHLIYRCDELHWECVEPLDYKTCKETRDQEVLVGVKNLSCAEFEKFPSARGCEQRVLYLTTHNFGTRFCMNDVFKEKELIF